MFYLVLFYKSGSSLPRSTVLRLPNWVLRQTTVKELQPRDWVGVDGDAVGTYGECPCAIVRKGVRHEGNVPSKWRQVRSSYLDKGEGTLDPRKTGYFTSPYNETLKFRLAILRNQKKGVLFGACRE